MQQSSPREGRLIFEHCVLLLQKLSWCGAERHTPYLGNYAASSLSQQNFITAVSPSVRTGDYCEYGAASPISSFDFLSSFANRDALVISLDSMTRLLPPAPCFCANNLPVCLAARISLCFEHDCSGCCVMVLSRQSEAAWCILCQLHCCRSSADLMRLLQFCVSLIRDSATPFMMKDGFGLRRDRGGAQHLPRQR